MSEVRSDAPAPSGAAHPLRHLLAALSGAAGVIHLAMVPSHMGEWAAEGVAFVLVGWFQLAWAVGVLSPRPGLHRRLLPLGIAANVLFVAAWVVTRTAGPPFGPHSGEAESSSLIDLATVGLELALVAVALGLLVRPGLLSGVARAVPTALAAGAVVLASAALVAPSTRNHAHGGADGHADGDEHAAGDDHAEGHHEGGGDDDRGLSLLRNGHHHEMVVHELDADTRAELDDQLAVTREVAASYPTVADAEAAGYRRIGPYFPGIGAHYGRTTPAELNPTGVMDREALLHPLAIIYDGTQPHSRVAGFMYLSTSDTEPEGFAGPNDTWHYHEELCLARQDNGEIDTPFGLDKQSTPEQCAAAGGGIMPISPWMVHVWSVPGWDDDPEVETFGEVHTDLTCADGSYHMLPVEEWVDHQDDVCRTAGV